MQCVPPCRRMARRFCAVDGESFTVDGEHTYVLLASSDGDYEYDRKGLPTWKCLEFLLSKGGKTCVAFGWNYDVNMILKDLTLFDLIALWYNGTTKYQRYTLEWLPGKWFAIRRGKRYVKIFDVFGFFQQSFIKALTSWGFEVDQAIIEGKGNRGEFTTETRYEVIKYCLMECELLKQLMEAVEKSLHSVDLSVSSWVGAGAIASALMRKYKIPKYHESDASFPSEVQTALAHAYFGGRSEVFQQGVFDAIYDYDISSAYPYEATQLPSLAGGKWRKINRYSSKIPFAVWDTSWNFNPESYVMPFPFRKGHDIYYPSRGRGWYHSAEVAQAKLLEGGKVTVHGGWAFDPADDVKPFDFIPLIYAERQRLKEADHGGEKVLKLGMNALYGKLAQILGYDGKPPPFQSLFWAGCITAGTRARILELARMNPKDLVMVATDGIFFSSPIDVQLTGGLGGLELTVGNDVFVAQPGVYAFREGDKIVGKTRGFFSSEIDFALLREEFLKHGATATIEYQTTRFCGLGYSLLTRNMDKWRTWPTSTRKLSLYPSRKFLHDSDISKTQARHFPPTFRHDEVSEPYSRAEHPLFTNEAIEQVVEYVQGTEQPQRA